MTETVADTMAEGADDAAALTPDEIDIVIRCRWLAGDSAEVIRRALGWTRIGVVGARVAALGLPPRDHRGELMWGMQIEPLVLTSRWPGEALARERTVAEAAAGGGLARLLPPPG